MDGKIERIVITDPGSGYCSTPKIVVPGYEKEKLEAKLGFSKELKKNGHIAAIDLKNAPNHKA